MLVIDFLKEHNKDFSKLTEVFGIKVKTYDDGCRPRLHVLNYDQIESPKTEPIVMECRGLILDDELNVICRPFDRFFNYGEAGTDKYDFEGYTFYPKLDGSLIKVYHWYGAWRIATRGTAFAESNVGDWGITFQELFLKAAGCKNMDEFQDKCWSAVMNVQETYLFELTALENRVVTHYTEPSVTLLAVRNCLTGEYTDMSSEVSLPDDFYKVNIAERGYTIEEIIKQADSLKNLEEGFVGYDMFNVPRVKVKSAAYVAVHHIRGEGLNDRRCCELVLSGECEEYLTYFPEDREIVLPYIHAFDVMVETLNSEMEKYKDIESQKDFALAIARVEGKAILFTCRKLGITINGALEGASLSLRVDLLRKYMKE